MNVASSSTPIHIDYTSTVSAHIAILGMTGSGKTNTIYVLAEEMLRAGGLLTILDPEGDFGPLKTGFPILVAGKGRLGNKVDLEIAIEQAADLATMIARRQQSIILDLSGYETESQDEFVAAYLGSLWRAYQNENLPPMRVVIDEVQLFAPESGTTKSKKLVQDIASRGRKRDFALLVATQRPQRVDKTTLDATSIRFFHGMEKGRGLSAIAELLPEQVDNAKGRIPQLQRGEAIIKVGREAAIIQVRGSDIFCTGTEKTVPSLVPPTALLDTLLLDLRAELGRPTVPNTPPDMIGLVAEIAQLRAENESLRVQMQTLSTQMQQVQIERDLLQTQANIGMPIPPLFKIAERDELTIYHAKAMQRRSFDALLKRLSAQKIYHRRVLQALLVAERPALSIEEIATRINISPLTLRKGPPTTLIKLGLIERDKVGRRVFAYTLEIDDYLQRHYPDMEPNALRAELLQHLASAA